MTQTDKWSHLWLDFLRDALKGCPIFIPGCDDFAELWHSGAKLFTTG